MQTYLTLFACAQVEGAVTLSVEPKDTVGAVVAKLAATKCAVFFWLLAIACIVWPLFVTFAFLLSQGTSALCSRRRCGLQA